MSPQGYAMSTPPVISARRLEDRIRELCARGLHTAEPEWSVGMHELQLAMQQHRLRLASLSPSGTVAGKPAAVRELRQS